METLLPYNELTAAELGNRDTIRANTQRGEEVIRIPLDKIVVREGFNCRQDYGDIDGLALSIIENGQTVAGRVDVLQNGTFMLTDGHRRFKACQQIAAMGEEITFKAIVNDKKMTEAERIIQMFTTQDNKQLEAAEQAELVSRYMRLTGCTQAAAAKKLGKTDAHISHLLNYSKENEQIKQHVADGHITVSEVVKIKNTIHSETERVNLINKAVATKKETGSTKTIKAAEITGKQTSWQIFKEYSTEISAAHLMNDKQKRGFEFFCKIRQNKVIRQDLINHFGP